VNARGRPAWSAVALAAALLAAAYVVLAPFLVPIAWAAILAYATWPVHRWVLGALAGRATLAALLMTGLVVCAIALPLVGLSLALADDVALAYRTLREWSASPPDLPRWVGDLPLVGGVLGDWHATWRASPEQVQRLVAERAAGWTQGLLATAGDVGRNVGRLFVTLLTIFFLYRHGEDITAQTQRVAERLAGETVRRRLALVGRTVRGVCYGVLLTALAQGLLAGLGFWAMGVPGAVLLGALTALLALVPFGPPLVWLPVALWVLSGDALWKGVFLLVWGLLVVSGADNVLRPYLIGGATQAPFLLVFFGVLGGLASFGLLGLFVGPTVLAVLLAVWRDWAVVAPPAD
jgi:predicted PurR-regulated permease PerM